MRPNHISPLYPYLLAWVVLLTCCQCSGQPEADGYGRQYPLDARSYAAIDNCMAYMDTDPARAHRMLDSVRQAGIMSPQRCLYLHAMVVFEGQSQPDSALTLCNQLLQADRWGDDRLIEAEVCDLATNIAASTDRYIELLQYANRGIALCHGREKLRAEEAAMLGRAGQAHQELGQLHQARLTYDRALELLHHDTSFSGFISRLSLLKKQAGLCFQTSDYDQTISLCHQVLHEVNAFDQDPTPVQPRPSTMTQSGEATHQFADFYQTQMYGRIAQAYRLKAEQGSPQEAQTCRDSASAYIHRWLGTAGSQSPANSLAVLHELQFTGHRAQYEAAIQAAPHYFGADTLQLNYIDLLRLMAHDAASRHDHQASAGYLQRAVAISDSLRQQQLVRTFAEQMSLHLVQEAQLAQRDAEYQLSRHRLLTALLSTLLLALLVIYALILLNRRRRALASVQHDLAETQDEVLELEQQLQDARSCRAAESMDTLYQRIQQTMTQKELYLNPYLDIRTLAEEIGSSRTTISACINSRTGKAFRLWLSEYRLHLFEQMLHQYPDQPIEELMTRCGYKEQSTLRRQFKAAYGMTVSEYRKQIK